MEFIEVIIGIVCLVVLFLAYHHIQRYISLDREFSITQHMRTIGQQKYEDLHKENEKHKASLIKAQERNEFLKEKIHELAERQKEIILEKKDLNIQLINLKTLEKMLFRLTMDAQERGDKAMTSAIEVILNILYFEDDKDESA